MLPRQTKRTETGLGDADGASAVGESPFAIVCVGRLSVVWCGGRVCVDAREKKVPLLSIGRVR